MAVGEFDTKVAVVVCDDLAVWQRLNVTAFLMSGITASAGDEAIGEDYLDADGRLSTGNDADNRGAVRRMPTAELDVVGLAVRAPHRDADALLRGLKRHP